MNVENSALERNLHLLLRLSIGAALLLSFILIFYLTLSYDEAWLISFYMEIYEGKKAVWKMIPMALTNGGIFVLSGTLLYTLLGVRVWAYRLLSFASLLGITYLLGRWSIKKWDDPVASAIVIAVFLGMWGSLELGALAYGAMPAMFLLLTGLSFVNGGKDSPKGALRWIVPGIFLGLAASARVNLLAIFPALLLESLFFSSNRKNSILQALAAMACGGLVFVLCQFIVMYITPDSSEEILEHSFEFTGLLNIWPDYPRIFNKWIVSNGFLPLALMIAATLYAFLDRTYPARCLRILVLFGWLHWLAWLIRAPIAHLRYLWPTISSFGVVLGFGLGAIHMWAKNSSRHAVSCSALAVALGFTTVAAVNGFRSLIHGEANIITWEWSRETPLSQYRYLRYLPEQIQMANYLASHILRGEEVGVLGIDLEMELLSGVKMVTLRYYQDKGEWTAAKLPRKLLITPMIGHYLYLDPALAVWMEENLTKLAQFGNYVLYQVSGSYPDNPRFFQFYHSPHPVFPLADPFFSKNSSF